MVLYQSTSRGDTDAEVAAPLAFAPKATSPRPRVSFGPTTRYIIPALPLPPPPTEDSHLLPRQQQQAPPLPLHVDLNNTRHDTTPAPLAPSSILSRSLGLLFVVCLVIVTVGTSHGHNDEWPEGSTMLTKLTSSLPPWRSSNRHLSPPPTKPTDQIQAFMKLWQEGRCKELKSIVSSDFEFQVTTFSEDAGIEGDNVYSMNLPDFIEELCEPYKGQFIIDFEQDNHNNLGRHFGTLRALGSDYYSAPLAGNAPCLAPFYVTLAMTLDHKGRIETLQEYVHNVQQYNDATSSCMDKGYGEADIEGSPRHRLLSKHNHSAHKKSKAVAPPPPPTNLQIAQQTLNDIWSGNCADMRSHLAEDFTFTLSKATPTPPIGPDELMGVCQDMFQHAPEFFYPTTSIGDGDVTTLSGPMLYLGIKNGKACPVFSPQSIASTHDPNGLITSMQVTMDDTLFARIAVCSSDEA